MKECRNEPASKPTEKAQARAAKAREPLGHSIDLATDLVRKDCANDRDVALSPGKCALRSRAHLELLSLVFVTESSALSHRNHVHISSTVACAIGSTRLAFILWFPASRLAS